MKVNISYSYIYYMSEHLKYNIDWKKPDIKSFFVVKTVILCISLVGMLAILTDKHQILVA